MTVERGQASLIICQVHLSPKGEKQGSSIKNFTMAIDVNTCVFPRLSL